MRNLSKSKLVAFRQCPKRLWLEVHRRELSEDTAQTKARFRTGNEVGDLARQLYDPEGKGALINAQTEGFGPALKRSWLLMASEHPVFEAGFTAGGALAFADVMLPENVGGQRAWRMVEVKASASVKDYHRDDIAVQAFVARSAGVELTSVALAHVDSSWTYEGDGNYQGLLTESDLTAEAFSRHDEVTEWIAQAQAVVAETAEPDIRTGPHCNDPFECGFMTHCQAQEPAVEFPVAWLPRVSTKALKARIENERLTELADVPDELLNEKQLRVKNHTLSGTAYFDAAGAAADLAGLALPATFLDFETVSLAIPVWKGTRPYQQMPFQFSAHRLFANGALEHSSFLDLSGDDPTRRFAEALLEVCGHPDPIYVYNATFEATCIKGLARHYPDLSAPLLALVERLFDLFNVAAQRYYHPSQQGSWSIKAVLPAIAPDLSYEALVGVNDGGLAMEAFKEAIASGTSSQRKAEIEQQLLAYCRLDTYAMVRLWAYFSGREVPSDR